MNDLKEALFGDGGVLKGRALLAFIVTLVTMYMWAEEIPVTDAQLVIVTGIDAYYFGVRGAQGAAKQALKLVPNGAPPGMQPDTIIFNNTPDDEPESPEEEAAA